ncbi:hypothetical protein [Clostridium botulinum]|uniref:hypothetical protein n=1 Tax=Clostridium botulinum TaxID=1491 RepID=UPI000773E623|nr:hypothetical protein [Clostridium botulinum]MBN3375836.1 hypothetical protein [Clostridium botulinum]MBN3414486.1 hypothetical protein [Clostridium botulinum]
MNDNLINKKAKYDELVKKTTIKYRKDMEDIKEIIEVIENNGEIKEDDTFETIIFKKYLELENVKKVADYINSLGYRVETQSYIGERKYTSIDISKIIAHDAPVEKKLKSVVQELHCKNSIAMMKKYF